MGQIAKGIAILLLTFGALAALGGIAGWAGSLTWGALTSSNTPQVVAPDTIESHPAIWGHVAVVEVPDSVLVVDGVPLLGLADPNRRLIYLRQGMTPELREAVLLHERCRIALADYGIDLPPASGMEERICDAMGVGMRDGRR